MPYKITQCYLPPVRGNIPAFTPAEAGTRFSNPGWMQGWVGLVGCFLAFTHFAVTWLVSRGCWIFMFCGRLDDAGHAVVWDCTVNVSFVSVSVRVRCSVTRDLLHSGQTVVADMPACCLSCAQFSYQLPDLMWQNCLLHCLLVSWVITHTHTHPLLTTRCPGLPRWAGTRKVKPVWILMKHPTIHFFYRPYALPAAQPTASKHWRSSHLTQNGHLQDACGFSQSVICLLKR